MSDRRNELTAPKTSGYYPSGGFDETTYDYSVSGMHGCGVWRNGRIVEPGDEMLDDMPDGMSELRELKRRGVPGY